MRFAPRASAVALTQRSAPGLRRRWPTMNASIVSAPEQGKAASIRLHGWPCLLDMPADPAGLVVFAGGGRRFSQRVGHVARVLRFHGHCSLRFDLPTETRAADRPGGHHLVEQLARRLERSLDWAARAPMLAGRQVALFGTGSGGAAALTVAAAHPGRVSAVVTLQGRPDLAGAHLHGVQAPTLMIVAGADREGLALHRTALRRLGGSRRLETIPGAGADFDEPGAMDSVSELAADWFDSHLRKGLRDH